MRGTDERSGSLFSYVDLEARVPQNHPLRAIRALTNATLAEISGDCEALYARTGRPGIAPEKLLRALLLQAFYSIRSERQLMEQLEFNLLFRWFVGLGVDERVWDATVFTKNRERLLAGEVASRFLARLIGLAAVRRLLSREHFSVDGTLIEAWASIKSFRPVDEEPPGEDGGGDGTDGGGRNRPRDFHGARWSNATHRSTTDADSRLYRKGRGKETKLSYMGHALMENRNGLVVDGLASRATGSAECLAGEVMLIRRDAAERAVTVGADKAYDTADFVETCTAFRVAPHVARNTSGRRSNIEDEVAASAPYRTSQVHRKRIEEVFAWVKTVAGLSKTRHRGLARVDWQFTLALAAYDLIRLPKLPGPPQPPICRPR